MGGQKTTIGIIGLGYWGTHVLRNFAAQSDYVVKYGCDLQDANIERMRAHYPAITYTKNADDLFTDPEVDLILIATPTSSHAELARKALEHEKHAFVEKPFTNSGKECDELVALAEKKKKLLFVDHTFVFAPAVQKMHELAKNGDLGDLLFFDSTRVNLGLIQSDVNVLWDLAIHDLSIIGLMQDLSTITQINAHGSKHFGKQVENAHLHLIFNSGFQAHIHVSWISPMKIRQTILTGTKKMVLFNDTEPSEKIRIYDKGVERDTAKPDPFFPKYRSGDVLIPDLSRTETLTLEAQHVIRCVQGKEKPLVSGKDGAIVVKILEAADRSLAQGGANVNLE